MKVGGLLEEGAHDLGLRFNLLNVLPTIALFAFALGLWWSGAPEQAPDYQRIAARFDEIEKGEGICLTLGVLVFALVLQPLQFTIVRLLEGYWPKWLGWLSKPAIARHQRRRSRLLQATQCTEEELSNEVRAEMLAADWRLRREYPAAARVLPTALGNALRAAEDAPFKRYKLDGVVIWPRLYPLLPPTMREMLADRRTQLDIAARLCVSMLLAWVLTLVFLRGQWGSLAVIGSATLVLAWLCYRGAVSAAVAHGETIQAAYDLYRFELHTALRLPVQPDLESERALNGALSTFFRQNIDGALASTPFSHKVEAAPTPHSE